MVRFCSFFILTLFVAVSCSTRVTLTEVRKFDHYPSASGIEYFNNQFYIIGDDAKELLITDSNLFTTDSIRLYSFSEKRIPKPLKADLEAISVVSDDHHSKLLILGSGSLSPYRNTGWLIDLLTKKADSTRLDTFYRRLKAEGLDEINIEGVCAVPGSIILCNRGNKTYPKNFLVIAKKEFWKDQLQSPFTLIQIGANADSATFNGVSGAAYAARSDQLILTVSTEDTRNSMEDGAIGKSYLWIVTNISSKKKWTAINPNKIIDLEKMDQRFKGQKIESVCVNAETKNVLQLVLAADNDNGSSTLFRLELKKD